MRGAESAKAIQEVRLAAHELANVCGAVVGGIPMAISLPTVKVIGEKATEEKIQGVKQ